MICPRYSRICVHDCVCVVMINEAAAKMEAIRREEEERCRKQAPSAVPLQSCLSSG